MNTKFWLNNEVVINPNSGIKRSFGFLTIREIIVNQDGTFYKTNEHKNKVFKEKELEFSSPEYVDISYCGGCEFYRIYRSGKTYLFSMDSQMGEYNISKDYKFGNTNFAIRQVGVNIGIVGTQQQPEQYVPFSFSEKVQFPKIGKVLSLRINTQTDEIEYLGYNYDIVNTEKFISCEDAFLYVAKTIRYAK